MYHSFTRNTAEIINSIAKFIFSSNERDQINPNNLN